LAIPFKKNRNSAESESESHDPKYLVHEFHRYINHEPFLEHSVLIELAGKMGEQRAAKRRKRRKEKKRKEKKKKKQCTLDMWVPGIKPRSAASLVAHLMMTAICCTPHPHPLPIYDLGQTT
jgi:hypothetical protein